MKQWKILFAFLFPVVTNIMAQNLILNEIMFSSSESNGEFIELFNKSFSDSIDLTEFGIKYHTSSADYLLPLKNGSLLPPRSYAIILEGDYDFVNGVYMNLIPDTVIVMTIDDNAFGSSGMSNSADREVSIVDKNGNVIDSHIYTADNQAGYSDELVNADENLEWKNSLVAGGTPGRKNSVSPVNYDLAIVHFSVTDTVQLINKSIGFSIEIFNYGINASNDFNVKVLSLVNGTDTIEIFDNTYSNLLPGDTLNINFYHEFSLVGIYKIIAFLISDKDEINSNDSADIEIKIFKPEANYNDIVINEIMYAPADEEPEWIEIFNRSKDTLNIKGWYVADNKSSALLTEADRYLYPESYIVITGDSSLTRYYKHEFNLLTTNLPSLNNGGDDVIIRDKYQNVIDSVTYTNESGGVYGKSLERISVDTPTNQLTNWRATTSKARGTPGRVNSLSTKMYDVEIDTVILKNPFQLINEITEIEVRIKNIGLSTIEKCFVKIFDEENEMLDFCTQEFVQTDESRYCTFGIEESKVGRKKYYCIASNDKDQFNDNDTFFFFIDYVDKLIGRNDLVINEIMYAPDPPVPEWIEIYNNSSEKINLKKMKMIVGSKHFNLSEKDYFINSGNYFLVSNDSSIMEIYPELRIVLIDFYNLKNTGEMLVLNDSLGRTIDSVYYHSEWGGKNGKSIERINVDRNGADSSNWLESLSVSGSTPGKKNSNALKNYDVIIDSVYYFPDKPVIGEKISLSISFKNRGIHPLTGNLIIYMVSNGLKEEIKNETLTIESESIASYDSLFRISSPVNLEILFKSENDEDTTNNKRCMEIIPGYLPASLLVNEIMFYPRDEMPEWIELYNNSEGPIYLNEFTISDRLTNATVTKIDSSLIKAHDYLVIASDSTFFNYYDSDIQVVIANLPVLNNDSDAVVIKDKRDVTIDSVYYRPYSSKKAGVSYERMSIYLSGNDTLNWEYSQDSTGSTPGRKNSIILHRYDLAVTDISFAADNILSDDIVGICCDIINQGTESANNFIIEIFTLKNGVQHLLERLVYNLLPPFDTVTVCTNEKYPAKENSELLVKIIYLHDEDTTDNELSAKLKLGYKKGTIVVNEIMYNPSENEPEWIEIFNTTEDEINLRGWSLSDVISEPAKKIIINEDQYIAPFQYKVVRAAGKNEYSRDAILLSEFPLLNNSEDGIVICDSYNNQIDSLFYKSGWGYKKGVSLEKIAPNLNACDSVNWTLSLSPLGSTPSSENSVSNLPHISDQQIVINEIMYEPDEINSEFIELYNNSDDTLQVGGLSIGGHNNLRIVNELTLISPHQYFLIGNDSALTDYYNTDAKLFVDKSFSLPNSGAEIKIVDFYGNSIDSLFYSPGWHNPLINSTKNKSIERINPSISSNDAKNWSTSVDVSGATPGSRNSIYTSGVTTEEAITIYPNPFSPDNDGFEDFTTITIKQKNNIGLVRIRIFDSKGRPVKTLEESRPVGAETIIVYDGFDDNLKPLRAGIYILLIEIIDEGGHKTVFKKPLVSARKL
ncbi:lamin tail domain-containing protein [Melioribacter sp. OK-6-Me]|uniref:lamin tail domain-containing protein n=1 Tax=unclassified Melioribacter TaxID=2627329 RepID=UPI003EDB294A